MNKKRKLIIIGSGGVHIKNFSELVAPLFDEVIFIGEKKIDTKHINQQFLLNFRSKSPLILFKTYKEIKKIVSQNNPAVIHLHQINRVAILSALVLRKHNNIVTTAWGSDVLIMPNKSVFFKRLVQYVLKKSKFVTADSKQMLNKIKLLSPSTKSSFFLFGIDPIKGGKKEKIIYSNRLHKKLYNIDTVINEFSEFSKSNNDWKLIIAGSGSDTVKLKELCTKLKITNRVEFVGFVDQKTNNHYYSIASIYISIPSSDGTAVSLLEAMSAGCIPIVRDLDVSKEWITNNENGILYPTKKPFEKALKIDRSTLSQINSNLIKSKGTKEVNQLILKEIYNSI